MGSRRDTLVAPETLLGCSRTRKRRMSKFVLNTRRQTQKRGSKEGGPAPRIKTCNRRRGVV